MEALHRDTIQSSKFESGKVWGEKKKRIVPQEVGISWWIIHNFEWRSKISPWSSLCSRFSPPKKGNCQAHPSSVCIYQWEREIFFFLLLAYPCSLLQQPQSVYFGRKANACPLLQYSMQNIASKIYWHGRKCGQRASNTQLLTNTPDFSSIHCSLCFVFGSESGNVHSPTGPIGARILFYLILFFLWKASTWQTVIAWVLGNWQYDFTTFWWGFFFFLWICFCLKCWLGTWKKMFQKCL